MRDWKGNDILAGQTVAVVNVSTPFAGTNRQVFLVTPDYQLIPGPVSIVKNEYCFRVSNRYEITPPGLDLVLSNCDKPSEIPINLVDMWVQVQPRQIICIEGVSDDETEYYTNKFKVLPDRPQDPK